MHQAVSNPSAPAACNVWRGTLAGASASLIGIGLTRFAYRPLLPAIIGRTLFPASTAVCLGVAALVLALCVDLLSALRAK
ncbi:hypothetical protein LMG27952_01103 [Paraburkholderia hiiakae]|uniref:Uncharacterized protein n=1 Tax=Paraburkholderia hiiakae TaxID=1081782 RepID=A0ABN7HHR6_9BURK|nr:hypothetical protein LMG27952_01103 [Paraburkholderia hiiakae]